MRGIGLFALWFGLSAGVAYAQAVHVQSLDADFDASKLASPSIVVDRPGEGPSDPLVAIPSEARDQIIQKAGLSGDLKTMDDLNKNLLMTRSRRLSVENLSRRYPKLSKTKLKKLSLELKQYFAEENQ